MSQFASFASFGEDFSTDSTWTTMVGADGGTGPAWINVPYVAPVNAETRCAHTSDEKGQCRGTKSMGRPWCVGHANSLRKQGLDPDVVTEWPT